MEAPYLFSAAAGRAEASITTVGDIEHDILEAAVHGRWTVQLRQDVYRGIYKCLAEHPAGLLVDLQDMDDPGGLSVAMWLAARRATMLLQPPVRLALCVNAATGLATRLRRIGAPRYLSTFATIAEARTSLVSGVPVPDVLQRRLPPDVTSPSLARDLVGEACHAWQLPQLLHPGRLVLSELATNGVEHARTDIWVTISRRGRGLHLSVRDGDPRMPYLLGPAPVAGQSFVARGQGLRLVHAAASAWGARPTHDGKVVWATVRAAKTEVRLG